MRIYLASGLENFANVREAAQRLQSSGHELAYDWTVHGDVRGEGSARMGEVAQNEAGAVTGADALLALLPGARGTHTEIGLAIASCLLRGSLKVYLYSETGEHFEAGQATCAFYFHPCVTRLTGELGDALDAVTGGRAHG